MPQAVHCIWELESWFLRMPTRSFFIQELMGNFKNGEMMTGKLNSNGYRLSNCRTGLTELSYKGACCVKQLKHLKDSLFLGLFYWEKCRKGEQVSTTMDQKLHIQVSYVGYWTSHEIRHYVGVLQHIHTLNNNVKVVTTVTTVTLSPLSPQSHCKNCNLLDLLQTFFLSSTWGNVLRLKNLHPDLKIDIWKKLRAKIWK